MRVNRWFCAAAAALLLVGAACARGQGDVRVTSLEHLVAPDSIFVEVINNNFYDARIHVLYDGGARYTVGTVGGNQRQEAVALPWQPRSLVVEITLIVEGGVYRSQALDVARGDVVEVRLPPNIASSGFFTRLAP